MSTWEADLAVGLAELLDAQTSGVWKPSGVYSAGETGIFLETMPVSPDLVIALYLAELPGGDGIGDVLWSVQVRTRGTKSPLVVKTLAGECRDALDGLSTTVINGIGVSQIRHQSGTSLGRDGNDRHQRSDNYYIDARRVTAFRHD